MQRRRGVVPVVAIGLAVSVAGLVSPVRATIDVPVDTTLVDPSQDVTPETVDTSPPNADEPTPAEPSTSAPTVTGTEAFVAESDGLIDVIVTFEPAADVDATAPDSPVAGMDVAHVYETVLDGAAVSVTPQQLAELQANPEVASVLPDITFQSFAPTSQWGLDRIDQRTSLNGTYYPSGTGSGVRIYIVDSGVVGSHPEFGGRVSQTLGYSAFPDRSPNGACYPHGTHVAGTAGGSRYGVAPASTIVSIRVMGCYGGGTWSDITAGLEYIVSNDPRDGKSVVNMSLGSTFGSSTSEARVASLETFEETVLKVINLGIPVVVAAGNSNIDACQTTPARIPQAITVGATNSSDQRADFSNFGSCVDIFAPGVDIMSANYQSDYYASSGTSMAAPHVAGAIAVLAKDATTTMDAAGEVVGTATPNAVVGAADSSNKIVYVGYPEALTMNTWSLPPAMRGKSYSAALQADGTHGPLTWQVVSGKLPKGVQVSPNGVVTWRSPSTKPVSFSVRVVSGTGNSITRSFTINVIKPLKVRTSSMPNASVGGYFSTSLVSEGGVPPYTWSLGGALPPGLTFSPSGSIQGTPTAGGKYRVTAVVSDGAGYTASKSYTITVKAPRGR